LPEKALGFLNGIIMKTFFQRYTPLQIAIHIYGWSALVRLIIDFVTDNLTANPIQALEQRTGRHALTLLVLSLACTPLNNLFGWRELLKRRRALGLYAFLYATLHVIIFVDLDYGLAWSLIVQTIVQKPYIVVGMLSFLMLMPLAFTSFDIWKKRLGKNWKRLHQMVYLIAPLAALHYAWGKKGDFFRLQGEIIRPLIYSVIILLFLIMRIPQVRKVLASVRDRIVVLFRKRGTQPKTDAA
jgi:methionine sulfoxide reductase heme-binding subunit